MDYVDIAEPNVRDILDKWQHKTKNMSARSHYINVNPIYDKEDILEQIREKLGEIDITYFHQTLDSNTLLERLEKRKFSFIWSSDFMINFGWHNTKKPQQRIDFFINAQKEDAVINILYDIFKDYEVLEPKQHSELGMLVSRNGELHIRYKQLKLQKTNVDTHYEGFDYDHLLRTISEKNRSGLILLHGEAGTGKTHLLRHLITDSDEEFVFLDNASLSKIADENFNDFVIDKLSGKILILEDGEDLMVDRKIKKSPYVSILLNMSDGLKSDFLNNKIILTYNYGDNIDGALLRKGRLLADIEIKPLSVDKANSLMKSLGKKHRFTEPATLADIYNWEDEPNENITNRDQQKIGFK